MRVKKGSKFSVNVNAIAARPQLEVIRNHTDIIADSNKSELFECTGYQLRSSRHWAFRKRVKGSTLPQGRLTKKFPVPSQEGPRSGK